MPNHLRAPAQHGDSLLSPEGSLAELARANEAALGRQLLWGRPIARIREEARAEVYSLAAQWTRDLLGSPVSEPERPAYWVMSGHQPELFHPGVWVKNAVVAALASQLGGVGLNLTVENDSCAGATVRVPRRPPVEAMTTLHWDQLRPQSPWEERVAPDPETFSRFGEICREHLRPWGIVPLASEQDWAASPTSNIVDRLIQLRSRFEQSAGIRNLELKVSDLADTQCFRRFLLGALREASELREAYNSSLADYRATNRIHSRSHPVPPLDATAQGIEVPFWVWRAGETHRGRLFVEASETETLRLHDGRREVGTISLRSEDVALQALSELRHQGWKIRPRALTLTLFSRVWLSSIFVHGIGGAKYDELTDALMQRWLGLTPPAIIVATATLRLFESFAGPDPLLEIRRLKAELRTMQWNPECFGEGTPVDAMSAGLRAEKTRLIAEKTAGRVTAISGRQKQQLRLRNSEIHTRIQAINAVLRRGLAQREQRALEELRSQLASVPDQQSLRSREFASNLFPAETIQDLFRRAQERVLRS